MLFKQQCRKNDGEIHKVEKSDTRQLPAKVQGQHGGSLRHKPNQHE